MWDGSVVIVPSTLEADDCSGAERRRSGRVIPGMACRSAIRFRKVRMPGWIRRRERLVGPSRTRVEGSCPLGH